MVMQVDMVVEVEHAKSKGFTCEVDHQGVVGVEGGNDSDREGRQHLCPAIYHDVRSLKSWVVGRRGGEGGPLRVADFSVSRLTFWVHIRSFRDDGRPGRLLDEENICKS